MVSAVSAMGARRTAGRLDELSGEFTDIGDEAAEHNRKAAADLERLTRQTGLGR